MKWRARGWLVGAMCVAATIVQAHTPTLKGRPTDETHAPTLKGRPTDETHMPTLEGRSTDETQPPTLKGRPTDVADTPADIAHVYDLAYNLDYAPALDAAKSIVAARPNDPEAYRAEAAVIWLDVVFLRGATPIDHYLASINEKQFNPPKPPADLDAAFSVAVEKAIALADAAVKARPKDPQAYYDLGSAWGLKGAYAAAVQNSLSGAFFSARRAFNAHEEVLDLAPSRIDANLIVGTYRYAVSTFGFATRMVAYIAGFGGGREQGIAQVEKSAQSPNTRADALFGLAVVYSREGRHAEAVAKLQELERLYPRNRLLFLEEGAALIRAGKADQAERVLTTAMAAFAQDTRPKFPGESALWLYKRGLARLNWNHPADAASDFTAALAAQPAGWVQARLHVEQGKLADIRGDRARALAEYAQGGQLARQYNDPLYAGFADRYRKTPFVLK